MIHAESRGTYGRPRIHEVLRKEGYRVGANRLRKVMLQRGLFGRKTRRFRRYTAYDSAPPAKNLLDRNFVASAPNKAWCGDITEFTIGGRRLFVAVVVDLFSRRVVGLSFSLRTNTQLVFRALLNAIELRQPSAGLLFHSDQGVQYRAFWYRQLLRQENTSQSMSRAGNCLDNAVAESFFATLEHELASRTTWTSVEQAERQIRSYILDFYNPERIHSTLGYVSPKQYEVAKAA